MKKLIAIIIFFAGAWLVWQQGWLPGVSRAPVVQKQELSQTLQNIKEEILTPPPLKSTRQSNTAYLTLHGVIEQTNLQRSANGNLPALKENAKLNQAATAKLKDMFAQQYFEHESPQGAGPADLAKAAGYEYIAIGENLALGNFDNDKVLVQDWMDSPGHRANILNSHFTEIGVAVGRGEYQGKTVWLAVQEFGRPASSCPSINQSIKSEIDSLQAEADKILVQLDGLKAELAATPEPKTQAEADAYNQKVAEYNSLIKIYNNKVDLLKSMTAEYNRQVNEYNTCIKQ